MKNRYISLRQRPDGLPQESDFEVRESELSALAEGQILIRNQWLSVDPYMRGRMTDRKSYIAPFDVGEPLEGGALGKVVESRHPDFQPGDLISSMLGWRDYAIADAEALQKLPSSPLPLQSFLGAAGMPGFTAWVGLNRIARLQAGETVFVSAASGAVGSMVCQLAKLKGCKVIGTAGTEEKLSWLRSIGVDAAVNYRDFSDAAALQEAVSEHCPEGIDVYYDNVGGDHFEAALNLLRPHGRVVLCGMIDLYNATSPVVGPGNLAQIIIKSLRIEGFIVFNHWDHYPEYLAELNDYVAQQQIVAQETVLDGLDSMPEAFIGLFTGRNLGKMLVRL